MSWKRLLFNGIDHWPASSQQSRYLDERDGLGNYVRLCKQPDHPMAYVARKEGRIKDFVWLQIDGEVAKWRATKFSNDNAVGNHAMISYDPDTALKSLSIQAEILVEGGINVRWIKFPGEWDEDSADFDLDLYF